MKNKKFKRKIALFIFIMQIFYLLPTFEVVATEMNVSFDFIIDLDIYKNGRIGDDNKPIGDLLTSTNDESEIKSTINIDDSLLLYYSFKIPNDQIIKAGQTYPVAIPKEIKMDFTGEVDLKDGNGTLIGKIKMNEAKDGFILTFPNDLSGLSNIEGFFYFQSTLDKTKIPYEKETNLVFDLGGSTDNLVEFNLNLEIDEPYNPEVIKNGVYIPEEKAIEWTIKFGKSGEVLYDAIFEDVISDNLQYKLESFSVQGETFVQENFNYDEATKKVTYKFDRVIEGEKIVKLKTLIVDNSIFDTEGKVTEISNIAKVMTKPNSTGVTSQDNPVDIEADFLNKSGSYNQNTRRITWTVNLNNNYQDVANMTFTDNLPEGLKYVEGTAKVNNKLISQMSIYDEATRVLEFNVIEDDKTAFSEKVTITFETDVTDISAISSDAGKTFTNEALLIGDGVPTLTWGGKTGTIGVGNVHVKSDLLSKSGRFNPSTGQITWYVRINAAKIDIINPTFEDVIELPQTYVDNTFKIDGVEIDDTLIYKASDISTNPGKLIYNFGKSINEEYIITYVTQLPGEYYGTNANYGVNNTAEFKSETFGSSPLKRTVNVRTSSNVIEKKASDYDYTTRIITWTIEVNKNNADLGEATITDDIDSSKLEFVEGSIEGTTGSGSYDSTTNILTYNFGSIDKKQTVTYKTKVKDSVFNVNTDISIENTASIKSDLTNVKVESSAKKDITSSFVKKGIKDVGTDRIEWRVDINYNKQSINLVSPATSFILEDNLQEGLELDTYSVKLVKQTLQSDGSLKDGEQIVLSDSAVKYNAKTNKFEFIFPNTELVGNKITSIYSLYFLTTVKSAYRNQKFSNTINLKGYSESYNSGANDIALESLSAGGGAYGESAKVVITKVDQETPTLKLAGAKFALLDKFDNIIRISDPTNNEGKFTFENLRLDKDYKIVEIKAPEGYVLQSTIDSGIQYTEEEILNLINAGTYDNKYFTSFKINSGETNKTLELAAVTNKMIKGNIKFIKYKEDKPSDLTQVIIAEKSLPQGGAKFKIYKENSNIALKYKDINVTEYNGVTINRDDDIEVTSEQDGLVRFENIPYGNYQIKESVAVSDYEKTKAIISAEIRVNGDTVDPRIIEDSTINVANRKNDGVINLLSRRNIQFTKLNDLGDNVTGAKFRIYKASDVGTKTYEEIISDSTLTAIKEVTTTSNGIVKFENMIVGDYAIVEISTAEKHFVNKNIKFVKVESSSPQNIQIASSEFTNNVYRGNIEFYKYGEAIPTDLKNTNKGVTVKEQANAVFVATRREATKGTKIYEATSDSTGKVLFNNLPFGTYNIVEKTAVSGYKKTGATIVATIAEDNVDVRPTITEVDEVTTKMNNDLNEPGVVNLLNRADLEFIKIYRSPIIIKPDQTLEGVKFGLFLDSETDYSESNAIRVETSLANGKVKFEGILSGSYKIVELQSINNYRRSEEVKTVVVNTNGTSNLASSYKFINEKWKSDLEFTKKFEAGIVHNAKGSAEFGLFVNSTDTTPYMKATSDPNGKVTFTGVEVGTYILKEMQAPSGYVKSNESITITITADKQTYILTEEQENLLENSITKGNIEITKISEDSNKPLEGAKFKIYNKLDTKFAESLGEIITDVDGKATLENLEYGEYVAKEVEAPTGHRLSSNTINFEIRENGVTVKKEFSNEIYKGTVKVTKVGESNDIKLSGAEFQLLKDGVVKYTAITNSDGIATFNDVYFGEYTLKESVAPTGYNLSSEVKTVNITTDGQIIDSGLTFSNTKIRGSIEINKFNGNKTLELAGVKFGLYELTDTEFSNPIKEVVTGINGKTTFENVEYGKYNIKEISTITGYVLSNYVTEVEIKTNEQKLVFELLNHIIKGGILVTKVNESNEALAGVQFTLYKVENDSEIKIAEKLTNASGIVEFTNLEYGRYIIKETKTLEGYVLSENEVSVFVDENNKVYTSQVINKRIKGDIEVIKESTEGESLEGAEFALYYKDDLGNSIATATTNSLGIALFKDIEYGKYVVKEIIPPVGYNLSQNPTQNVTVAVNKETYTITFVNEIIKGGIEIIKTGENSDLLSGAEFTLYDSNNNVVDVKTTGNDGKVIFTNVKFGVYKVKETKAPEGYNLSNIEKTVTVSEEGKLYSEAFSNTKIRGSVKVVKFGEKDKEGNTSKLQGAEFAIYHKGDVNPGREIETKTTGSNGEVIFSNYEYGNYVIRETKAPVGYNLEVVGDKTSLDKEIFIEENLKTYELEYENTKIRGSVRVVKVGEENDLLEGAEFTIYNKSDVELERPLETKITGSNGEVIFSNYEYGNYVIRETKAPVGYNLEVVGDKTSLDREVFIEENLKTYELEYENTRIRGSVKVVKLGEDKNPLEGAEFTIYNKSDVEFKTPLEAKTTGLNGEVVFENYKYGDYVIKETKAPVGYNLEDIKNSLSKDVSITENLKIYELEYLNTKIRGSVKVVKVGEYNNPLEGAEFTIYNKLDSQFKNPLGVKTTNSNGEAVFENYEYGDYVVRETKAPEGYNLEVVGDVTSKDRDVSITENLKVYELEYLNTKIKGNIEITKFGENADALEGVEFTLYEKSDIEFKNPILVSITDNNGIAKFKDVQYGQYVIKETKEKVGYNNSDKTVEINVLENGKLYTGTFENTKIRGSIEVIKKDDKGRLVTGAEFTLYSYDDVKFENPLQPSALTDKDGIVKFGNVEYGKYIIKETKPAEGYLISEIDNQVVIVTEHGVNYVSEFNNEVIKGNIIITKVSEDGTLLSDVEFTLYSEDDIKFKKPLEVVVTGNDGLAVFRNVEYGKYKIKETRAKEGYNISDKVLDINVNEHEKIYDFKVVNTKIIGEISGTKISNTTKLALEGAEFALYSINDKNFRYPLSFAISDKEGKLSFENVEYGRYLLKETKAPNGYVLMNEAIEVNITEHGAIYEFEIGNQRIRGSIVLLFNVGKVPGIEVTIYPKDDPKNPIKTVTSDKNGEIIIEDLESGDYIIVITKVPDGYEILDKKIEVSITKDGEVVTPNVSGENSMIEKKKDVLPQTGVVITTGIKLVIALVSIGAGTILFKKKKED